MARIIALHGVVPKRDSRLFVHRNMASESALGPFLAGSRPFVSIADALAGRGDALTIDDGTQAAANAALLARAHGHAVTMFVNPAQVESGEPYWFVLLSALIDGCVEPSYVFGGRVFAMAEARGRSALREAIKTECRRDGDEESRARYVRSLADRWNVTLRVPASLETLTRPDLRALHEKGVAIENHGWSHADHSAISAEAGAREISRGREWLQRELGVPATFFAVPYGDVKPSGILPDGAALWLTSNAAWPPGVLAPGTFNREDPDLRSSLKRSEQSRRRGSILRWTSRVLQRFVP